MRKSLIALALLAGFPALVAAENLSQIYKDAVKADPTYAGARALVEAARERVTQGKAGLRPQVNMTGDYKLNGQKSQPTDSQASLFVPSNRNDYLTWQAGINASQPIYRPQNATDYDSAKLGLQQAESQASAAAQDLMVRVTQAYFDVLLAQDSVDYLKSQEAAIAEQLAQAKRNFEVGTATITDTYDAQARFDLVKAQQISAQNQFEVAVRALQQIIARMPGKLATLVDPIALSLPEPNDIERWVEQAYKSSWDVAVQKSNLDLANAALEKAKAGHHPTLDAIGGTTYNFNQGSGFGPGSESYGYVVGLEFALPLYTSGKLTGAVREAIANRSKAEQDYEAAKRQVAQNTRQSFLGVVSGLAETKALEQALASNKLSLDASKLGQEVGVRTQVDVLNAQERFFSARRNLQRARYNTILNQIRLKAAVGKLNDRDMETLNSLLREAKS